MLSMHDMTTTRPDDLAGRVALITGGGRGIGRAISLRLGQRGAAVAVNYRRDRASAQQTVEDLRKLGVAACAVRASVDSPAQCQTMVATTQSRLGPISILVNNAGVASRPGVLASCDLDEVTRLWKTNTLGPLRLCQAVLPAMRAEPRGDIIMISSAATSLWPAFGGPYNLAKAGMEALAYTLAHEEQRHGIRVNIVAPGLVATEMGRRLVKSAIGGAAVEDLDGRAPFGRVCRPEDVAAVVDFLCSEGGGYMTGERLKVDGGSPELVATEARARRG